MQTQLGKLLLQPTKPSSTLEIFVAPQELVDKSNLGQLFVLIEINSREKNLKEKIKQVIELIQNDYYSSPVMDIENALESTCQNLNLNLNEIFAKPDIWFKKINILVGVSRDNILTFSQVGRFSSYLMRHKKITQILDTTPLELEENNLFSQLTTGEVKIGDIVIFANYTLFDFFSLEKIREVVSKLKPEQAAQQFKNLMSENIKVPQTVSLIIKYEQEPFPDKDISEQTKKYLQELYGSQESMQQLENLEQRTGRTLTTSLWPGLNKVKKLLSFKSQKSLIGGKEKKSLKLPIVKDKKKVLADVPQFNQEDKDKLQTKIKKPKLTAFLPKFSDKMESKEKLEQKAGLVSFKNKVNLLQLIVILVVVFLASLIYLNYHQQVKQKDTNYQNILIEVDDKKSAAQAVLIYQDTEKANLLLNQALQLLDNLPPDEDKWQLEAEKERQEIAQLINKINNVFEVDLVRVVDLATAQTGTINQVIKISRQLYALTSNGNVYKILPSEKSFTFSWQNSEIKQLADYDEEKLIFLTQDNKFYLRDGQEDQLFNITLAAEAQVVDIQGYGERIYVLDNYAPAIYKISKPASANPEISVWAQEDKQLLAQAKDMVIDGHIWLINQNEIIKMFKGGQEDFSLAKLDKNLGFDLEIYTQPDWDLIYILDRQNNRLVVIDKEGVAQRQFMHAKLNQTKDLIVNDAQTKAWLSMSAEILEIDLEVE